jgi:hypothetical protein
MGVAHIKSNTPHPAPSHSNIGSSADSSHHLLCLATGSLCHHPCVQPFLCFLAKVRQLCQAAPVITLRGSGQIQWRSYVVLSADPDDLATTSRPVPSNNIGSRHLASSPALQGKLASTQQPCDATMQTAGTNGKRQAQ